jgi:AcrR family transcriptional regulator
MARTRKDAMARTREALIAAGIAAVTSEGLDASLDGICARAGYTRGAFYVHFRDRDDLLVALMDRVGELFLRALFAGGSLPATVERFVAAIASGEYPLTPAGSVRPHQLLAACARSEAVRARYVGLIATSLEQLLAMVRQGQTGPLRDDVAADEVATLLMAIVIGAQTMMELRVPLEPPRLARAVLALLARSSLPSPSSPSSPSSPPAAPSRASSTRTRSSRAAATGPRARQPRPRAR